MIVNGLFFFSSADGFDLDLRGEDSSAEWLVEYFDLLTVYCAAATLFDESFLAT